MFTRIRDYLKFTLWNFSLKKIGGYRYYLFKILRIAYLSIRGFAQDRCMLRASALTYYTMMAIVPVLAMSFAVAKGFGFQEHLQNELLQRFSEQKEIVSKIMEFSKNLLIKAKGGVIAGVGVAVLFWSVIKVLHHIESALNQIWGIKKNRHWQRKFGDYFSIALLGPIVFILASSTTVFIVSKLESIVHHVATPIAAPILFLIRLIPYGLIWVLFTFTYIFMTNTKVRFLPALTGGIIAGTFYQIVQGIYLFFQIGMTKYSAVYGSFAAIPLFLIWLQLSWFIVLFGGEISYASQNIDEYEFELNCTQISHNFFLLLCLWVAHQSIQRFTHGRPPITADEVQEKLEIPKTLVDRIYNQLVHAEILVELRSDKKKKTILQPGKSIINLKIKDVIDAIDKKGSDDIPHIASKSLDELKGCLESFAKLIENSPDNRLIKDINHEEENV